MINFLAKSMFVTVVWRRYKRLIVSTALLFVAYFLVALIHDDYMEYARTANSGNLAGAYLLKWAVLLAATVIYYLVNFPVPSLRGTAKKRPVKKPPLSRQKIKEAPAQIPEERDSADPFDSIRRKKKLKARGDALLHQEKQK